jgi:hypothetical protein
MERFGATHNGLGIANPLKEMVGTWVAVMLCVPEVSVLVVYFAAPPLTDAVFRTVVPS